MLRAWILGLLLVVGNPLFAASRSIDVNASTMTVHVYRAGVFSFAGDNHEVRAPLASGTVDEQKRSVEITVDARKLLVVDPNLSASKRSQVQQTMLGPEVLDAGRHPAIRFTSTAVEQDGAELRVRGNLTMHGETRPVTVRVSGSQSRYRGSATLRQTEFGIKPIRVAGGTVKVKDEVRIDFDIVVK